MNQADKAEALRLLADIVSINAGSGSIQIKSVGQLSANAVALRALIERQNDTDGEMWRFCRKHGFPKYSIEGSDWRCWVGADSFVEGTPVKAVQAAMAAMKEKA